MKITLINSTDGGGGAGIACKRLAEALSQQSQEVTMFSQKKKSDPFSFSEYYIENSIDKAFYFGRHLLNKSYIRKYPNVLQSNFSVGFFGALAHREKAIKNADLIHLHWINDSFISIPEIKKIASLKKKMVWTLHDMWPFTGGCHYSGTCKKYESYCGNCPVLDSKDKFDLSFKQLAAKLDCFQNIDFQIITPSRWLAGLARESNLFKNDNVHAISNALNTEIYKPLDKKYIRGKFNIGLDKKIILFGAVNAIKDERKGLRYLLESLQIIKEKDPENKLNIELAVFGSESDNSIVLPFKTHFLGNLYGDFAMVEAYNIADIFAITSLQDNLPNTVMESMACQVPVIGFNVGGIPEMIDHLANGFVAQSFLPSDIAKGIEWLLEEPIRYQNIAVAARKKTVKEYGYEVVAKKHLDIYHSM